MPASEPTAADLALVARTDRPAPSAGPRWPTFTVRAYFRSHMVAPRGVGCWAFQRSATEAAFTMDLSGEVVFSPTLSLSDARKWLAEQGHSGLWAVLP